MRTIFGMLSLLIVLVVVGVLAKKQLGVSSPVHAQNAALADQAVTVPLALPGASPQAQSQQIQQQIKRSVEAAMQQRHPMSDDFP